MSAVEHGKGRLDESFSQHPSGRLLHVALDVFSAVSARDDAPQAFEPHSVRGLLLIRRLQRIIETDDV